MKKVDLIVHAKWVLPIEPANTILNDHAVVVQAGEIIDILPSAMVASQYEAKEVVKRSNHVVLPGFINSHAHAAMSLLRGYADDLKLMDWLKNYIWPAEANWVDKSFVYDGSSLAMAEMIKSGTTCFNDMYFFQDETIKAAQQIGMRANIGLTVLGVPNAWAKNEQEYLEKSQKIYEAYNQEALVTFSMAPHSPYMVSQDALVKIENIADELDIGIVMHVQETKAELEQVLERTGLRPYAYLQQLGLASERFTAVHSVNLTEEDVEIISHTGINIVHCPESNMKLSSGFCPAQTLLDLGVNVALGTDGAASNNNLDMLGEMQTAAFLSKFATDDPTTLNATQVLQMATINGARAMGLDDQIGSLESGKQADMIAVDLGGIENQPVYNPISHLVYAVTRDAVNDVWVAGKQLLKNKKLTTIDAQSLSEKATEWGVRIKMNKP